MNQDEFAFFNQQLAAMLRDGLPLEGSLKRLCAEMRQGPLRQELSALEGDLSRGTPLAQALQARQLPELYRRLLTLGAQSQDLPGVLNLLADHYQRSHQLWTRLKGLMIYPAMVLVAALGLSILLAYITHALITNALTGVPVAPIFITPWVVTGLLTLATVAWFTALATPNLRRWLRWRIPAFREASLAGVAASLSLMLKSGVPLDQALALAAQLEAGSLAGKELATWREKLAAGQGKFAAMSAGSRIFPPLFLWLVPQSGDDLAAGLASAAELYQARAHYQTEMVLYSVLPCAVLGLGMIILLEIEPVISAFQSFIAYLGGDV